MLLLRFGLMDMQLVSIFSNTGKMARGAAAVGGFPMARKCHGGMMPSMPCHMRDMTCMW